MKDKMECSAQDIVISLSLLSPRSIAFGSQFYIRDFDDYIDDSYHQLLLQIRLEAIVVNLEI